MGETFNIVLAAYSRKAFNVMVMSLGRVELNYSIVNLELSSNPGYLNKQ